MLNVIWNALQSPKHIVVEPSDLVLNHSESGFDLETFLMKTASHIPNQDEYCQLVNYLARIEYSKTKANAICNKYWNANQKYPEYETRDFMSRFNPQMKPVSEG